MNIEQIVYNILSDIVIVIIKYQESIVLELMSIEIVYNTRILLNY